MLKMSPTSTTQKSRNFVDEFDKGNRCENRARRASTSTKGPTRKDYPSSNHVSHAVSNIVSNSSKIVSNYPTPDIKKAFDQLRQAFTKAPIL